MTAAQLVGTMSYAEYLEFERTAETKHEYVNGQVYAMAGGSTEHARLAAEVIGQLLQTRRDRSCAVFSADLRVRILATGRSTYPDVTVICEHLQRAPDDQHAATNPTVIVEVLSEGTESLDRGDKWRHYRRIPSLQAYVLVSQAEPQVEVFRRAGDVWQYQAAGPGERLQLDDEGLSIDVDALYRSSLPG
ncbi:MAG TPA: Uma2 family endonuclease [Enhygromyxa sp.]|nr:Uma2 family endonuclease [Enhygromyxa sp.]